MILLSYLGLNRGNCFCVILIGDARGTLHVLYLMIPHDTSMFSCSLKIIYFALLYFVIFCRNFELF